MLREEAYMVSSHTECTIISNICYIGSIVYLATSLVLALPSLHLLSTPIFTRRIGGDYTISLKQKAQTILTELLGIAYYLARKNNAHLPLASANDLAGEKKKLKCSQSELKLTDRSVLISYCWKAKKMPGLLKPYWKRKRDRPIIGGNRTRREK
jgi:hypothetical protein